MYGEAVASDERPNHPLFAGRIGDVVSNQRPRYHEFLLQLKLYAFETISTIVVLVLLADFAIKEIHPIIRSIWNLLRAP
jgi:hypothetical protein